MKVLFWIFVGFDQHATSEHLLSAVIEQLCKSGHSVHIIQKYTGGTLPSIPENLSGYDVSSDVIKIKQANKNNFIARYITELKYINTCKKRITSEFDAVFIQSTNVAKFAVKTIRKKLPNALITFNVQDVFPYNAVYSGMIKNNSLLFKVLANFQRYAYMHSDHVITISEDMKETLIADGVDESKISVIYNWSYQDDVYENVDKTKVAYMFNSDYFNVVYAGNIGIMQNVDIIIEAAKAIKKDKTIWFHIIGNGLYRDKLEARAKEYGITNISFWPLQSPALAPAIYSSADINVIPLVKNIYKTALPSKTATCFACQKPIVFAIGDGSSFGKKASAEAGCLIVDSDDADQLVESIYRLKNNSSDNNEGEFFRNNFSKSANSLRYAQIITTGDL